MASALYKLCYSLKENTEKLEEELKRNIVECHKLLIGGKATETKLALEKAKDYHYKEVVDILKDIVKSIRLIMFHEEKIRTLNDESNFDPQELKRYSYVQRQVKAFSNNEEAVSKREKRRVVSEISVESLEAWENYFEKKEEEEEALQQVQVTDIPKRKVSSNRKKKKFVSSTFNNFLDGRNGKDVLDSICEDEQLDLDDEINEDDSTGKLGQNYHCREFGNISSTSLSSIYESESEDENFEEQTSENEDEKQNLSTLDILEALNEEYIRTFDNSNQDNKPKIVEVIYKKKQT